jgi:ATP-dependent DNA ligase
LIKNYKLKERKEKLESLTQLLNEKIKFSYTKFFKFLDNDSLMLNILIMKQRSLNFGLNGNLMVKDFNKHLDKGMLYVNKEIFNSKYTLRVTILGARVGVIKGESNNSLQIVSFLCGIKHEGSYYSIGNMKLKNKTTILPFQNELLKKYTTFQKPKNYVLSSKIRYVTDIWFVPNFVCNVKFNCMERSEKKFKIHLYGMPEQFHFRELSFDSFVNYDHKNINVVDDSVETSSYNDIMKMFQNLKIK